MGIKNKKLIAIGLGIVAVLAVIGSVGALNGWFTGKNNIPEDTFTRGLVAYWSFDEGSGQIAYDASGNNNNGTLGAAAGIASDDPKWTQGKIGQALSFDGVDDYVSIPHNDNLNITEGITIEAWVNPNASQSSIWVSIVGKGWGNWTPANWNYLLGLESLKPRIVYGGGLTASKSIPSNKWSHIVFTGDRSSNSLKIYIDGVLVSQGTMTSAPTTNTYSLNITRANYFQGLIDEVRIYNRALSAEEIRYHYNRGGPVGWWKFDEGSGSIVYDSSGNGNNGTLNLGTSGNTTTSNAWVSGKSGSALSFDGVDDYVSLGDVSKYPLSGAVIATISMWVKQNTLSSNRTFFGMHNPWGQRLYLANYGNNWDMGIGSNPWGSGYSGVLEPATTNWTHITVVLNGSSAVMYVNGKRTITKNYTSINPTGTLTIGAMNEFGIIRYFWNGLIDDVRIYNYALTPDEIKLLYNAGYAAHFGPKTDCNSDPGSCMDYGLVGYWSFNEGSGQIAYDASGNNNNGTLGATSNVASDDPKWTTGKVGGTLSFDGSNDYVNAGSGQSLKVIDVTIEAWIKEIGRINVAKIVSRRDPSMTSSFYFLGSTNGYPYAGIGDGSSYTLIQKPTQMTLNQWHHLVFVFSDAQNLGWLYEDGVLVAGPTTINQSIGNLEGVKLSIGADIQGTSGYFNGLIDEVRIYNRALSAEEIRYHYNRGGPVGWWKFDEGSGSIVYDSSGNGNNGTLNLGTSGNTTTSNAWVSGKSGSALSFDGVDDYVVGTTNGFSINSGTISMWVYPINIIDKYLFIIGSYNNQQISLDTDEGGLHLDLYNGGSRLVTEKFNISTNQWYYITGVYDTNKVQLYINGQLFSQKIGSNPVTSLSSNWYLGRYSGSGSYYFNGLIDDVRIYNYARTPEQILQDYNAGLSTHFK